MYIDLPAPNKCRVQLQLTQFARFHGSGPARSGVYSLELVGDRCRCPCPTWTHQTAERVRNLLGSESAAKRHLRRLRYEHDGGSPKRKLIDRPSISRPSHELKPRADRGGVGDVCMNPWHPLDTRITKQLPASGDFCKRGSRLFFFFRPLPPGGMAAYFEMHTESERRTLGSEKSSA